MKEPNSIDLIESCLTQIYRIRKKVIAQKSKYNKQSLALRSNDVSKAFLNVQRISSPSKVGFMTDEELEREQDFQKEEETLVKDIVSTYPNVKPENTKTRRPINTEELEIIKNEFEREVENMKRIDVLDEIEGIEEAVNKLVDKYLTNKLDLVEQSPAVGALKREIAVGIEHLAIFLEDADELRKETAIKLAAQVQQQHQEQQQKKAQQQKQMSSFDGAFPSGNKGSGSFSTATRTSISNSTRNSVSFTLPTTQSTTPIVDSQPTETQEKPHKRAASPHTTTVRAHQQIDKKEQEKQKIKQQYEAYLKTKQRVEKQHREVSDRETLSVEIASVIDSIRSGEK